MITIFSGFFMFTRVYGIIQILKIHKFDLLNIQSHTRFYISILICMNCKPHAIWIQSNMLLLLI
jgi:hypothetical protein